MKQHLYDTSFLFIYLFNFYLLNESLADWSLKMINWMHIEWEIDCLGHNPNPGARLAQLN